MLCLVFIFSTFLFAAQAQSACQGEPDFLSGVNATARQEFLSIVQDDSISQYDRDNQLTTWANQQGGTLPAQVSQWKSAASTAATQFNNNITSALLSAPGAWIQLLVTWQNIFTPRSQQIATSKTQFGSFDPTVKAILLAAAAPETYPRGPGAVIGQCSGGASSLPPLPTLLPTELPTTTVV